MSVLSLSRGAGKLKGARNEGIYNFSLISYFDNAAEQFSPSIDMLQPQGVHVLYCNLYTVTLLAVNDRIACLAPNPNVD
jgi:hypothetical protein